MATSLTYLLIDPSAFISVPARRTLGPPSMPPEVIQTTPSIMSNPETDQPSVERRKREWPGPVREYVQRSFAESNQIGGVSKEELQEKLKQVISEAAEKGKLSLLDWQTLPLPQVMIETERLRAHTALNNSWKDQLTALPGPGTNHFSNNTVITNKRKSDVVDIDVDQGPMPPWRNTNPRNTLEDRISYADKRPRNESEARVPFKPPNTLESRKRRFEGNFNGASNNTKPTSFQGNTPPVIVDTGPVVGRCQDLEKGYFRLTSAPNPDNVRPLPVLEKTLELLKKKWRKDNNYTYICNQFKSLRQDLTVQHIKNDFTVNVYEIHARIALEKGDLGEYNQCQTQLRALYEQNVGGHPTEFKAYRILYFLHTGNRTDMNDVLADLTPTEKKTTPIKHALNARSALALGNYHRFFQLYLDTPNMGAYLMDMFVSRERLAALANMCKA